MSLHPIFIVSAVSWYFASRHTAPWFDSDCIDCPLLDDKNKEFYLVFTTLFDSSKRLIY